jgi:hypothetical protein
VWQITQKLICFTIRYLILLEQTIRMQRVNVGYAQSPRGKAHLTAEMTVRLVQNDFKIGRLMAIRRCSHRGLSKLTRLYGTQAGGSGIARRSSFAVRKQRRNCVTSRYKTRGEANPGSLVVVTVMA